MGLSKSRTVTLIVALATLTSNTLSSLLFHQLPDDPYHLASNFGWYLHFANILSVFGFIGAVRQHALSIAIFSHYLIIDTILCAVPRFLVLGLLHQLSSSICTPTSSTPSSSTSGFPFGLPTLQVIAAPAKPSTVSSLLASPSGASSTFPASGSLQSHLSQFTKDWTPEGCIQIVWLAQLTLLAGLVAATLLQFVGALRVREYARCLWLKDLREEGGFIGVEERGVVMVFEEDEEGSSRGLTAHEVVVVMGEKC